MSQTLTSHLTEILKPGQTIVIAQGASFPSAIVATLPSFLSRLQGSTIYLGMVPANFPDLPGCAIHTFFPSGPFATTRGIEERSIKYERWSLFDFSSMIHMRALPVDIAFGQAAMIEDGDLSLGVHLDFIAPAVVRAEQVLLEVSPATPAVGAWRVALRDGLHTVVAGSGAERRAPVVFDGATDSLSERLIEWIPDGATIELGMGRWFAPLIARLAAQRRNLRVHSGSVGPWIQTLREAGAMAPEMAVATAAPGTQAFYDSIDKLGIELLPAYRTHAPATLQALPNFRALNSALEVDLCGNVNTEITRGGRRGGIGGLADFAQGACRNPEGLSIIALDAVAGLNSRIVLALAPEAVSLGGQFVDVVVTQFGTADLRGLDDLARALAIVAVAHPEHRAGLLAKAADRGLL